MVYISYVEYNLSKNICKIHKHISICIYIYIYMYIYILSLSEKKNRQLFPHCFQMIGFYVWRTKRNWKQTRQFLSVFEIMALWRKTCENLGRLIKEQLMKKTGAADQWTTDTKLLSVGNRSASPLFNLFVTSCSIRIHSFRMRFGFTLLATGCCFE